MASLVTFAELKLRARQRADMENSRFVQDPELGGYVNKSATELYDLLTTVFEDYYSQSAAISIVPGTSRYDLPADFYKLTAVDEAVAAGQGITISRYNFQERNRFQTPSGARSVKLWYIPVMPSMVLDADTFDGINGWDEYIVVDVARKLLQKEESDTQPLILEKSDLINRINACAPNRDAGTPSMMVDVNARDQWEFGTMGSALRQRITGNQIEFLEGLITGEFR
jgi:hypothetical protein